MEKKNLKNKVKKFWNEKKELIICGGAIVGTVIVTAMTVKKINDEFKDHDEEGNLILKSLENSEPYDYGRDCLMTFTVEDTGEVLWKERCTESYVDDMKDWGMEYENTRKLNGLE